MRWSFQAVPFLAILGASLATDVHAAASTPEPTRILSVSSVFPLVFEENRGQADSTVRFLSRSPGVRSSSALRRSRPRAARTGGGGRAPFSPVARRELRACDPRGRAARVEEQRLPRQRPEPVDFGRGSVRARDLLGSLSRDRPLLLRERPPFRARLRRFSRRRSARDPARDLGSAAHAHRPARRPRPLDRRRRRRRALPGDLPGDRRPARRRRGPQWNECERLSESSVRGRRET